MHAKFRWKIVKDAKVIAKVENALNFSPNVVNGGPQDFG